MQNKLHRTCAGLILSSSLFCGLAFADIQLSEHSPDNKQTNTPDSHPIHQQATSQLDEGWADEQSTAEETVAIDIPIAQIRKFIETFQLVKNNYVAAVTDDELFENSIHGLVEGLDAYSRYLDAEHYQQLMEFTEGQIAKPSFTVEFDKTQQIWIITGLESSTDAYRQGLRNGQIVEKINKVRLQDLDRKLIDQLMVGSLGSIAKFDIKNEQASKSFDVVRDKKVEYDVEPYLTDEKILVLKIKAFQKDTTEQVQEILSVYQSQSDLKGILIDLRDNPGGLLSASVELADLFLEQGLIVSTKGRLEAPQRFQALPSAKPIEHPIAILQNRYSASAAEVFAAALKEQNRAIILGERSYGKGAIQKLFPLEQGALQMTVAYYYTPQGHLIEGKGIEPNEVIAIIRSHTDGDTLTAAVKMFHQTILSKAPSPTP